MRLVDPNGKWFKELLTGQQSWAAFKTELNGAAFQMGQDSPVWNDAMNNPLIAGAGVGMMSGPASAYIGGSGMPTIARFGGGILAQYAGGVVSNVANGQRGGAILRPRSNAKQFALSGATVMFTVTGLSEAGSLVIGSISGASSFLSDRLGGQPITVRGLVTNLVNGVAAGATDGLLSGAAGVFG